VTHTPGGILDHGEGYEQRIHTPIPIVARLRRFWGSIAFDPCGSPFSCVNADRQCYPEHADPKMRNGLIVRPWPARTFCNPPYKAIGDWISAGIDCPDVVYLIPWRSHRRYFRPAMARSQAHVCLDPIAFAGNDHSYPLPLVLIRFASDDRGSAFVDAFADLGDGHVGGIYKHRARQTSMF
jgi:hypothetical protein